MILISIKMPSSIDQKHTYIKRYTNEQKHITYSRVPQVQPLILTKSRLSKALCLYCTPLYLHPPSQTRR
ncbi:hypothetical protein Sjap_013691 [Stephania japonica]|uniref:Uncharacterized protein n=1 Tax=Stephania japonica TaxID=461633 RepID=A0AAP0NZA9_9MAGN